MTDFSAKDKVSRITQMTHGAWKGPSNPVEVAGQQNQQTGKRPR